MAFVTDASSVFHFRSGEVKSVMWSRRRDATKSSKTRLAMSGCWMIIPLVQLPSIRWYSTRSVLSICSSLRTVLVVDGVGALVLVDGLSSEAPTPVMVKMGIWPGDVAGGPGGIWHQ